MTFLALLALTAVCSFVPLGLDIWLLVSSYRHSRHHDHLLPSTPRSPRG
ncbi:hypothetical protein [uncultured Sphingomonas sp.]|nr:hypothetical protein [uncultured Sphingomonas sp.]